MTYGHILKSFRKFFSHRKRFRLVKEGQMEKTDMLVGQFHKLCNNGKLKTMESLEK